MTDSEFLVKEGKDWDISASSLKNQALLDGMASGYLYKHPKFVEFAILKDPALRGKSFEEARDELCTYPGVKAIAAHEIAHELYKTGEISKKLQARRLSEAAHTQTGIDIHPGTKIGENCFIDHGTGDVFGEVGTIGKNTVIYQGVTLGAYGKIEDPKHRHPVVGDYCLISSGVGVFGNVKIGNKVTIHPQAVLVGNNITIGNHASIGPGARIADANEIADGVKVGAGVLIPGGMGHIEGIQLQNSKGELLFHKDKDGNNTGRPLMGIPDYTEVSKDAKGKLHFDKISKVKEEAGLIKGTLVNVAEHLGLKELLPSDWQTASLAR